MQNNITKLVGALEMMLERLPEPPDANCSCHISPPCNDCVDYAGEREAFEYAKGVLAEVEADTQHGIDSLSQQLELERGTLLAETERKQQLQGQVDMLLAALAKISGMTMSMYTSAGEAMRDAKRIAHEAIAAAEQAQHHCKNCEGVQPETCGFNVKQQADDADAEWRRLALQFDGHRMQALAHLRGLLENPESHAEAVRAFLAAPPLSGEQVLANRIAEQALKPVSLTRDWPKIDAAMRDYVESYEMIGDNNEVCYSPTKAEQELIIDCMRGLLAESDFIDMLTAQPTAQQQIVATQLVCDALVAIVAHSGDPAGTVAALAEWRKKAEAFTRNPVAQPPALAVPSRMSYKNATQEFADGYNACIDDMLAAVPQATAEDSSVVLGAGAVPGALTGKFRMLVAVCNRIEEAAEEFVAADGLAMGVSIDDWHEFTEALTAARKALAAAQKDPRQAFAEYHLGKPFSIPTTATLRDIAVNSRHGLSVIFCDGDFQVSCTANVWLGDRAVSGWFKELPDAINALWADMEKARQEATAQKGGAQ